MFFVIMKRIILILFSRFILCLTFLVILSCDTSEDADFSELTKIALRDAGNQLLLSQRDSTSLILPVIELNENTYQLAFNEPLTFEPTSLVSIVQESIRRLELPEHYIVEVMQCNDREVAYSYQISVEEEQTIIPCSDRYLPEACYLVKVNFFKLVKPFTISGVLLPLGILLALIGISFLIQKQLKSKNLSPSQNDKNIEKLGSFYFYPEQNKLVKEAEEIALSKKECELLGLFVANPNQIIKRDELTKRLWEDNGVFVGRSLDTYISKLRKKLKSDTSIKLSNVHGVGYKLEVN
ncbi:two-component system response regulator [Winogradskyella sp. PG-2]|nr:two-component system response regulator [Winogradskyella sp. PG-2]